MGRVLMTAFSIVFVLTTVSMAFAQNTPREATLDLKVHQGVWSSQETTAGEYFFTLQFYTNGQADFCLCRKDPDIPCSSPILATYRGAYATEADALKFTLRLEPAMEATDLPVAVNVLLAAQSTEDSLTVAWYESDRPFADFWDGGAMALEFGRYP